MHNNIINRVRTSYRISSMCVICIHIDGEAKKLARTEG